MMAKVRAVAEVGKVLGVCILVFGLMGALRLMGVKELPGDRDEDIDE